MKQPRDRVTFTCPVCGEEVEAGAPGCRECGSTAETGWSPDTEYDGLDLPYRDEEDNDEAMREPRRFPLWVIVTAVVVTIASIILAIR